MGWPIAQQEMDDENERLAAKAGNMKELQSLLANNPGFEKAVLDSVESVKIQLVQILQRLQLKERFSLQPPRRIWMLAGVLFNSLMNQPLPRLKRHPFQAILTSRCFWSIAAGHNTIPLKFANVVPLTAQSANQ